MDIMEALRDDLMGKWLAARDGVIGQVEMLGDEQLAWCPGEGARTGLQVARHIAGAADALLAYATRGERPAFTEPTDPATREQVLEALRSGRERIESSLRSLTAEELAGEIPGLFGDSGPRFGFLAFSYAHEMYHFGQLGLCARASGEVPALTQFIQQKMSEASA